MVKKVVKQAATNDIPPSTNGVNVTRRKLSDYKFDPANPRKDTPRGRTMLENSVSEFGPARSGVVDKSGVIRAGNHTAEQLYAAGIEEVIEIETTGKEWVVVKRTDMDSKTGKKYSIADNRSGELGEYDPDVLAGFADEGIDLAQFWNDDELAALLGDDNETTPAPDAQMDKAEELQGKWQVARGDLWQIGDHRLLCGDSTNADDVARVMAGEKADICLTDPPYGLVGKKASGKNNYDEYEDSRENLDKLAAFWLPIARDLCKVVVFSPGVTNAWIYPEADWIMCWFYGGGQLRSSWGFNCWQPFLCYGKDPSLASGNGGRPDAVNMNTPANAEDLDHPCPKPLPLWNWFIERLSFKRDEIFFDPFGGSGTTLVACEQTKRKCRAIEISPKYCAVILQRMSDMGIVPQKVTHG